MTSDLSPFSTGFGLKAISYGVGSPTTEDILSAKRAAKKLEGIAVLVNLILREEKGSGRWNMEAVTVGTFDRVVAHYLSGLSVYGSSTTVYDTSEKNLQPAKLQFTSQGKWTVNMRGQIITR